MSDTIPTWAIRTKADERAIAEGCYWDQKAADRFVFYTNRFFKTQFSKRFRLTEAQSQVLQQLTGWRLPNGNRRFRFVNLHVAKKSFGKTMLCAILVFWELYASGEPSPFICSAAASKENAAQIFDEVRFAIERSPFWNADKDISLTKIRRHNKDLEVPSLNARYRSLASLGDKIHGYNASLAIVDEAHVAPVELWRALCYSIRARPNGMVVAISTAGSDQTHWYYSIYQKSKRVLAGDDLDITHFAYVTEMDQDGDPEDPKQWYKANPLMGNPWCPEDQFRRELETAKSSGLGSWLNFLRLMLNKWVVADELAYFSVDKFDDLKADPSEDQLKGCPAAVGVDLSEAGDPSSVSITFDLGDGNTFTRSWAWVAEDNFREREKGLLRTYRDFPEITITKGSMIDERLVLAHLVDLCRRYRVQVVNFDLRSAYVMANRLGEETGVDYQQVPANARHFNPAMTEFKKAMEQGRAKHDGSSWLKFCLQNVRFKVNGFDEVYPVRHKAPDKIDGAYSCLLSYLGILANKSNMVTQGIVA